MELGRRIKELLIAAGLSSALVTIPVDEGKRNTTYIDPVGIATACYGHTGPEVRMGQRYSDEECLNLMYKDIWTAWQTVQRCYPDAHLLNPNQRSAWVSFTYNVGPGGKGVKDGFCRLKSGAEPTLLRKLKAHDFDGACKELPKWNAQKLPGITKRRSKEEALCLKKWE